jgi:hypothetical protein
MEVKGQLHVPAALPTEWQFGWAPESVWTFYRREKALAPGRIRTPTRPSVAWSLYRLLKVTVIVYPMLPEFGKVPRLLPFAPLVRATCR